MSNQCLLMWFISILWGTRNTIWVIWLRILCPFIGFISMRHYRERASWVSERSIESLFTLLLSKHQPFGPFAKLLKSFFCSLKYLFQHSISKTNHFKYASESFFFSGEKFGLKWYHFKIQFSVHFVVTVVQWMCVIQEKKKKNCSKTY